MDGGWGWNQGAEGPYMQPSLGEGTDTLGTNFLQKMRPQERSKQWFSRAKGLLQGKTGVHARVGRVQFPVGPHTQETLHPSDVPVRGGR